MERRVRNGTDSEHQFRVTAYAALVTDPGVGPWYIFALVLYFIAAKALSPLPVWSQLALIAAVSVPVATHLVELPWAWQFISMYGLAFFAGMHGQRLLMRLADRTTWVTVLIAGGVWGVGTVGMYLLPWPFGRTCSFRSARQGLPLAFRLPPLRTGPPFWLGSADARCRSISCTSR